MTKQFQGGWVAFLCCGMVATFAQDVPTDEAARQIQRQHIQAERTRLEAAWGAQEAACHSRFMVQSCLDKLDAERRTVEQEFKRQEALLNAADRRQRAQEQLDRAAEKAKERQAREAELQPSKKPDPQQALEERQSAHKPNAAAPAATSNKAATSGPSAQDKASYRQAFTAKLRAAQAHREERDKRLRESADTLPSLPTPP